MLTAGSTFGTPPRRALVQTLAALAMAAASSAALADPIIWSQPAVANGTLFSSENDTTAGGSGHFSTVYDDFTFSSAAVITDVHWTGGFFDCLECVGNPSGFTIAFWADAGGAPGAQLLSEHVNGNAGQGSGFACGAFNCFTYQIDPLAASFAAAAGTRYWISIVADQGFPPNWGLLQANGGDGNGVAVQDFFGARSALQTDIAFQLSGTTSGAAVPEPATLALLGAGLAGLGFSRRRKGD